MASVGCVEALGEWKRARIGEHAPASSCSDHEASWFRAHRRGAPRVRPTISFRGRRGRAIGRAMPQKPQARAKDKKRLTKRLANWRKKQELAAPPPEAPKTATKG